MHNLDRFLKKIDKLAAACRAEIDASDRPLDALPVKWVVPTFFVHPDCQAGWEQSVAPEVWERIHRLGQDPEPLIIPEDQLQRTPFALSHAEVRQFRNGPLLRMMSLVDLRRARGNGGRTKRQVEIALREALEFEVFKRDVEIGALISCKGARYGGATIKVTKGSGLGKLVDLAWVPGVPTKGKAADKSLPEMDKRLALFETLRSEGEKLAVAWLHGLGAPAEAEASIVAQVRANAVNAQSESSFDTAIKRSAHRVHLLMRACVHVTDVAGAKHKLAKRAKRAGGLRRRPKDGNLFHTEPMTRQQHALFAGNQFSAVELAFLAVTADIDPNLITTNHVLAAPEFRLAQKLGRIGRAHPTALDLEEIKDMKGLLFCDRGYAENAMFRDVHIYLEDCALELHPLAEWSRRLDNALAQQQELILPG